MSTGSGGKPPSASQPGRPVAETPQRLVVRSHDAANDSAIMGSDTAVAVATKPSGEGPRPALDETSSTGEGGTSPVATPAGGTPSLTELVGTTLSGRYLVTRKVGQGGMGAVYEATHTLIGKRVAVKVLLEKYAQREAIVRRLKQEAQLASSIGNEHIIDITDIGQTDDGRTFVVMEFLEGESLAECLARETKLPEQRILHIMSQAAGALAAAHDKGIVHRDIKPENLFLLRRKDTDFVKVVDFGISKSLRATGEEEETTRLTQTGMVLGTPLYMSPEQARGDEQLDHRVDIYALGVIMYEAATGRVPFVGSNYLSVISQVLNEEPQPLREQRPELSEEFEAIVMKAMAKDVNERYASANAMLADLSALLDDPTHSTERARITGPRRRLVRKAAASSRYVVWAAGIAVVIAAVVVSVTQMLGGSTKNADASAGSGNANVVAPPPPPDAAVAAVPVDAAPSEPEPEYVNIMIYSTPPGASVLLDGVDKGRTPLPVRVLRRSKEIEGWVQLEGYDAQKFNLNPLEYEEGGELKLAPLKKPPKGRPVQRATVKSDTKAAPVAPRDKTGGDFSGNPFKAGGNVPSTK